MLTQQGERCPHLDVNRMKNYVVDHRLVKGCINFSLQEKSGFLDFGEILVFFPKRVGHGYVWHISWFRMVCLAL